MKRPYHQTYYPPVPAMQVRIGSAETGRYTDDLAGIVDTGADAAIVPIALLDQVEAAVEGYNSVRSQWGEARPVNLYSVDVIVEEITLPGILVVGDEVGNELILGRDVLNRLQILLDGLNQQTEIVGY
jgi:hypothetical protein